MVARELSIGQVAARSGLAVSALRYYEALGLIAANRTAGGQRRFERSVIRRLAFIQIAQQFGLSLDAVGQLLEGLPEGRTPTREDWAVISQTLRDRLDRQIESLSVMRDRLDGCVGCGCLSLDRCALYNPEDRAGQAGSGPRYLLGNDPSGEAQV